MKIESPRGPAQTRKEFLRPSTPMASQSNSRETTAIGYANYARGCCKQSEGDTPTARAQRRKTRRCFLCASQLRFLGSDPATYARYLIDFIGERDGIRTHDLLIKSQMLYQLSYALLEERGWSSRINAAGQ
jgi:hypothetical protein